MGNEFVKLGDDEFKKAMKNTIDGIDVNDHVLFNMCFEKNEGEVVARKHIHITIDKLSAKDVIELNDLTGLGDDGHEQE